MKSWGSSGKSLVRYIPDYKHFLCIVNYFSKFLTVEHMDKLSLACLLSCCKSVSVEYGLSKKVISDKEISFTSNSKHF